jgi:hypothetical protein
VFITQRRGSHPVRRRHGPNRKGRASARSSFVPGLPWAGAQAETLSAEHGQVKRL